MRERTHHRLPKVGWRKDDWWRGAVIYQVYPRSYQDTDGDGIGDLPGITRRLEHIAGLGADLVWISPFMKSPMKDYGYDVADYCDVDPMFGTLDDFDRLVARAKELGMGVMIDFVASHTSSQHAWFLESRESRDNPKADWYVWADAKPDGSPPNNWQAVFGGPTWEWEPRRRQYYLHNFLKEQPDLNFHNPQVIAALLGAAEFWLQRGIAGIRLDAIDFGVHDPQLRDNPPRPRDAEAALNGPGNTPHDMQRQLWNKARPELSDLFFKPLHALTERYGGRVLLGEISGDGALERMAEYSDGGGLDIAYSFDLLTCPPTPSAIRGIVEAVETSLGGGWACWSFCNHDVTRAVTRFAAGGEATTQLRAMVPILLCSLRGTACLYQGEELGLEEAELAFEDLLDPYGITFWPNYKGRDGCRTPMPWSADDPGAGFTSSRPWLPVAAPHRPWAVDRQAGVAGSVLEQVRAFLAWRRGQEPIRRGDIRFVDAGEQVLAFTRGHGGRRILCLFNLSREPASAAATGTVLFASAGAAIEAGSAALPPHAWLFAELPGES
ncbi:MAG: alpha-glucosidase family protein [Geminicoccaceae bacterium]